MTLTGLPGAGADPELHHYKEKYKNEGPSENEQQRLKRKGSEL